jgi:hypothetical protein
MVPEVDQGIVRTGIDGEKVQIRPATACRSLSTTAGADAA